MQNEPLEHRHYTEPDVSADADTQVSLSHVSHVLHAYRSVIVIAVLCVMIAYGLGALVYYLLSPAYRVTTQTFRLDFEGAGQGRYPNSLPFNSVDIINQPILARVWEQNHLSDYLPFGDFSRAVYILESNREYELVAAEYQSKLADPKLSPVDRERIQKEFESKLQSIAKNEYAVAFNRPAATRALPEPLARKTLLDILTGWADFAVNQQHVTSYQVFVLSPEVVALESQPNGIIADVVVLREKVNRILANITAMEKLPGAMLARTNSDHLSLEELRLRLDDIVRFRLEPLLAAVLRSPLAGDRAAAARFLQNQLAYDQRRLDGAQREAEAARDAIAVYEQPARSSESTAKVSAKSTVDDTKSGDAVMPQLSDTFLDRLMTLSGRGADLQYRQKLVDDYHRAVQLEIPIQQAVAYDQQLIDTMRADGSTVAMNPTSVQAELDASRREVADLIAKTNDLYRVISRNMTASTQLFTLTGPPVTRTTRGASLSRLTLYGLLVFLAAVPAVIAGCLVHNRIREEEAADHYEAVRDSVS